MNKTLKYALMNSLLAVGYVSLVVTIMSNTEKMSDQYAGPLVGVVMLLLFVISATIMASIVLGRPILWYLDGLKKEAIQLLAYTIGFLIVELLLILLTMFLII